MFTVIVLKSYFIDFSGRYKIDYWKDVMPMVLISWEYKLTHFKVFCYMLWQFFYTIGNTANLSASLVWYYEQFILKSWVLWYSKHIYLFAWDASDIQKFVINLFVHTVLMFFFLVFEFTTCLVICDMISCLLIGIVYS